VAKSELKPEPGYEEQLSAFIMQADETLKHD